MEKVNERLVVLLTPTLKRSFTKLADEHGRSASEEARIALQEYIDAPGDMGVVMERLERLETKMDTLIAALNRFDPWNAA